MENPGDNAIQPASKQQWICMYTSMRSGIVSQRLNHPLRMNTIPEGVKSS